MKKHLVLLLLLMLTSFYSNIKADNLDKTSIVIGLAYEKEMDPILGDKTVIDTTTFNFQPFWTTFRKAVLANDTIEIIRHTKFPFETRGPLDRDPVVKYERKDFIRVFRKYLNQYSGGATPSETELDVIRNVEFINTKADRRCYVDDKWARIGDLLFKLIDHEWKLTFVYLDYPTIDALKKK